MMRYFLNLVSLNDIVHDLDGAEFENIHDAESEALQTIRDIAAEDLRFEQQFDLISVRISDEKGQHLREVFAADALKPIIRSVVISSIPSSQFGSHLPSTVADGA